MFGCVVRGKAVSPESYLYQNIKCNTMCALTLDIDIENYKNIYLFLRLSVVLQCHRPLFVQKIVQVKGTSAYCSFLGSWSSLWFHH